MYTQLRLKKYSLKSSFLILLIAFWLVGCKSSDSGSSSSSTVTRSGSGQIVHLNYDGADGTLKYTQDLGSTPQDVYFVFTNPTGSNLNGSTIVSNIYSNTENTETAASLSPSVSENSSISSPDFLDFPQMGTAEIAEFNRHNPALQEQPSQAPSLFSFLSLYELPVFSVVDETNDLKDKNSSAISSTLKIQVADTTSDVTLNIWVEDASWGNTNPTGCSKSPYCLTNDMISVFADKFLKVGSNNDIYDWVTDIIGVPWGVHYSSKFIPAMDPIVIDILFYDIDADASNGSIVGYFHSKDVCLPTVEGCEDSNQKLMFYLDSAWAAYKEGSTWGISDKGPATIVSTMAHEFQHMVHFYQKSVKNQTSNSDTWINEMSSMVIEDLLADKILADGPRGVGYATGSAGSSSNTDGRLPRYNYYNYGSVTDWQNSLVNYSLNYSLGAFLSRNYGGAKLFKQIVQNPYTDSRAVTQALSALGYNLSFTDILQRWGAAVLLSDLTSAPTGYRYNTGGYVNSTGDTYSFNLGSINLFNYYPTPTITDMTYYYLIGQNKTSNRFGKVGTRLTGSHTWTVEAPAGVKVTVVTKNSD